MSSTIKRAIAMITGREAARRVRETMVTALDLARSELSDEAALIRLREQTGKTPRAGRRALKVLRVSRDEFDHDRAWRLLEASLTHTPVQPIKSNCVGLFLREEALGRKPMREAFNDLKELASGLVELESTMKPQHGGWSQADFASVRHRVVTLVGPAASEQLDSLARSQIALTIATQYLAILGGDCRYGNAQTSYFSAPHKLYIRAGVM